jgi:hypothetical protein
MPASARTILDVFREVAPVTRLSDAAAWARALEPEPLVDLVADRYGAYVRSWRHPEPTTLGVRPYLPVVLPDLDPAPGIGWADAPPRLRPSVPAMQLGLGFGYDAAAANTELIVTKLKQMLLLCESVAIDNPLGATRELWWGAPRGVGFGRAQAEALASYAELIGRLEPLIETGALVLVEHPFGLDGRDPEDGGRPVWPPALEAERALLEELAEASRPSSIDLRYGSETLADDLLRHFSLVDMAHALCVSKRSGAYEPLAPGELLQGSLAEAETFCWQLIADELGWPPVTAAEARRGREREQKLQRLQTFLELELPLLALRLEDVITVREESQFAPLRATIVSAVDRVLASLDRDDPAWAETARARLAQELAEPREALWREVRASPTLSDAAAKAGRTFVLAFATAGVPISVASNLVQGGEPLAALALVGAETAVAAAVTAVLSAARDLQAERKLPPGTVRDTGRAAAFEHLRVLSPPLETL